jgi:asparagine synthase (glutamine-hydrolysing)
MGARHLAYRVDQNQILASSYEMALVAHPSVDYRLNDDTIGRHLVSQMQSGPSSIIAGLEVLHPGHSMEITNGEIEYRRFYKPDPKYRVRYASDAEYAAEFKRLLNQAVERRLRCSGNVGSQLSGGLDSVPITIAAALYQAAEPNMATMASDEAGHSVADSGQRLSAYSWVFDQYPEADERQYSSPICSVYGIEQVTINCDTRWLDYCDTASGAAASGAAAANSHSLLDPLGPIYNPFMSYNQALFSQAKARGVKVMLNGIHGDILYGYTQGILYELVKSGKFKDALSEARYQLIANGSLVAFIKEYLLKPIPIITRFLNWRALRRSDHHEALQPHILQRVKHGSSYLESESRNAIRPQQWQVVLGEFAGRDAAIGRFLESEYSIERRYPFRDRDLCEFMLAIPSRQLALSGIKRPIVKRAFVSELPANMVNRNRKATFAEVTVKGIQSDQKNAYWANLANPQWSYYVKECYFADKSEINHQLEVVKWRCGYYDYWKSVCYYPMAKHLGLSNETTK